MGLFSLRALPHWGALGAAFEVSLPTLGKSQWPLCLLTAHSYPITEPLPVNRAGTAGRCHPGRASALKFQRQLSLTDLFESACKIKNQNLIPSLFLVTEN